jgi:hypothetical protein
MAYAVYVTGQHVDDRAYRYRIQPVSQPLLTRQRVFWDAVTGQIDDIKDLVEYFSEQSSDAIQKIMEKGKEALQNVTNDAVEAITETFAHALHLHDFYSAHLLPYCDTSLPFAGCDAAQPKECDTLLQAQGFVSFQL